MDIDNVYRILLNSINISKKYSARSVLWDLIHIWSMLNSECKDIEDVAGVKILEEECEKLVKSRFSSESTSEFMNNCKGQKYFGEETGYVIDVYLSRLVR